MIIWSVHQSNLVPGRGPIRITLKLKTCESGERTKVFTPTDSSLIAQPAVLITRRGPWLQALFPETNQSPRASGAVAIKRLGGRSLLSNWLALERPSALQKKIMRNINSRLNFGHHFQRWNFPRIKTVVTCPYHVSIDCHHV